MLAKSVSQCWSEPSHRYSNCALICKVDPTILKVVIASLNPQKDVWPIDVPFLDQYPYSFGWIT